MALEEYIKQVKETWTNYTLDLVNYQNRCRLIRFAKKIARKDVINTNVSFIEGGMTFSTNAVRI